MTNDTTTPGAGEELKACPFCGAEPDVIVRGGAAGVRCRREHLVQTYGANKAQAVAAWNTRAAASVATASGNEEVAAEVEGEGSRETLKPLPPPRPVAGEGETKPVITDEMVAQAMTDAWAEICADTECHPQDIVQLGRKRLMFQPSHWADLTAMRLRGLFSAPPPPAEAWKPDREAVARLVLPDAWVRGRGETQESMTRRRAWSLGQANAILALQSPGAQTRDQRQAQAFDWMSAAFGPQTIVQRGVRLAEEAIEAAQAAEVPRDMLHKLVDHIYDRPAGDLRQELGGVGVTLLGLAAAAGLSADECEAAELARVLAKPLAFFAARNAAKNDAGFNADLPTPAKGGE